MKQIAALSLLIGIFLIGYSQAQDNIPDWAWKTPMTKVYPTGEYYNLPLAQDQVQYQNPNTTTRVVNQNGQYLVLPPNIRPFPHTATQSEVDADNMGGNTQIIYASWNSYGPAFYGCGFAFSSNGGTTWSGSHQTTSPNSGDPGPWVWPTGTAWAGRLGLSYISGAGYSTNNGVTWVHAQNFSGGSSFDKNLSAVDDISGSPFLGRAYTVWTYFSTNRIYISYSTDGGVTWSVGAVVSPVPAGGHHHQGCDVEVGPGGVVYVVWGNCTTNGQNSTEDFLGFAKSTNGGVSWTGVTDNAVDINGIRAQNLFNGIRANGFPRIAVDATGGPRNGWIYVTLAEKTIAPATDVGDITLCRSTDGGATWPTHTRVNQDPPATGRFQYFSDVDVAPDGSVGISYYDQRNTTGFVTEYWFSRSLNGGTNWTDVAASDHTFTPAPIPGLAGGYQGDYTGITTAAGKFWPFWAENSSGTYQVWTTGILYGPPPVNDIIVGPFLSLPSNFTAGNNYTIKARFTNGGSANQTNVPTRFSVNGVLTSSGTIASLPANGVDSASFTWNPASAGTYTLRIYSAAAADENRGNDTVTTSVNVSPAGTIITQTQYCRNGLNIPIPSIGDAPPDSIVVNIPNSYDVVDVNVRLDTVIHTWDGDLVFKLSHLAMQNYAFVSQVGGSGDNFIQCKLDDSAATSISSGSAPFIGTWRPTSPLNVFNSLQVNGSWRLNISDVASGDSGFLRAWCLQLTYRVLLGGIQTIEIPNYYSLGQNYPNPFNPVTTIKYGIPTSGDVTLKVYDLLGREVKTLVNERKEPGVYYVDFDATNLASGIYLYKIESGNFSAVKKMMLIK